MATSSEAIVAQRNAFAVERCAGKTRVWCACGRSSSQLFGDGSHKGTGLMPMLFKAQQDGTAYLCGCKASQGRPFCDDSHNRL